MKVLLIFANLIMMLIKLVFIIIGYTVKSLLCFISFVVLFISNTCGKFVAVVGGLIGIGTILLSISCRHK